MTVQFIKSPSGEEMVVLSKAEYEAMDEAADVAAYDAVKADPDGCGRLSPEDSRGVLDQARSRT